MLIRFSAASFVACIATALASLVTLMFFGLKPQQFALILAIWCSVPCAWGLWAMLTPSGWVPRRLPIWGAILGILAGFMAIFVLDLPSRIFGVVLPNLTRIFLTVLAGLFYYALWIIVSFVYNRLLGSSSASSRP